MQRAAWLSAAVLLVVCGACASTGTPATTGPQLRVGVDLPLTGHHAGAAAADFAYLNLHIQRAAVISDHEAYGQGLADSFIARLSTLGGSVLGHLDLAPGAADAAPFLRGMKDAGAQAIYYGGESHAGCSLRA